MRKKIQNYNFGTLTSTLCMFHTDWGIWNSRPVQTGSDTCASYSALTLKLISRPPARRPACRVQVRQAKDWFTLYVTFPFRRGTSPFSKIFSCLFKRICSHWQECLGEFSVPFLRRRRARMFDGTARVPTSLGTCSILILISMTVSSSTLRVFACNECCLGWHNLMF